MRKKDRDGYNMIYFDNSATTAVLPEAAEAAKKYMCDMYYNPAAAYSPAVAVERDVNAARTRLASCLNADASELIFTSGGTESNNMALAGTLAAKHGKCRLITSAVEHPSVFEPVTAMKQQGYDVVVIGVDGTGKLRMDELAAALDETVGYVSIMHVNNESGAINDISRINALIKKQSPDAVFHVDGVQAFVKMPAVKCDMYSMSGHKLHAPKGIGALYVRQGVRFMGGQKGGGQENGLRSGTTNVPGIMALDAACSNYIANHEANMDRMLKVKRRLYSNLMRIRDVRLNGGSRTVHPEYELFGSKGRGASAFADGKGTACFHRLGVRSKAQRQEQGVDRYGHHRRATGWSDQIQLLAAEYRGGSRRGSTVHR